MKIVCGGLDDARVQDLLAHHARSARAETAPGSAHALDLHDLRSPAVRQTHRRLGIGSSLLRHILDAARALGFTRVSLETGSWPYFEPARAFYRKHGFMECAAFGDHVADTNSTFMTLETQDRGRAGLAAANRWRRQADLGSGEPS
jgi:putative acetyltransferase